MNAPKKLPRNRIERLIAAKEEMSSLLAVLRQDSVHHDIEEGEIAGCVERLQLAIDMEVNATITNLCS